MLSREATHRPLNLLVNLVDIFRGALTLLSLSLVLASVTWWLPLAFLIPLIPVTFAVAHSQMDIFREMLGKGLPARLIKYYLSVLLDVKYAKEIRVFRASAFFMDKYQQAFSELEHQLHVVRKKQLMRPQPWNLLYLCSSIGVMFWFVDFLSTGKISFGSLLGIIQSISFFGLSCQWMVYSFANVGVCFGFFSRFKDLESVSVREEAPRDGDGIFPLEEIRFENVSFSYPGETAVLRNISFTMRQGELIAIVGENGAGKSTLIKLLCRLYASTSGRITCNGVDIADIDIARWRRQISAVFQDFGHYNLSIRENITFSSNASTQEDDVSFRRACRAARFEQADAEGADALLGKEFAGTLSHCDGAQWCTTRPHRPLQQRSGVLPRLLLIHLCAHHLADEHVGYHEQIKATTRDA